MKKILFVVPLYKNRSPSQRFRIEQFTDFFQENGFICETSSLITWKDKAIIWITDINTGKWIDAKLAFYDTENITPMAYGFSAHITKDTIKRDQEIINFAEVSKRVIKIGK